MKTFRKKIFWLLIFLLAFSGVNKSSFVHALPVPIVFAVIGDYGTAGANEAAVANLVKSWNPDFVVTVGDNNYLYGGADTIDQNIGQYYHEFIYPYMGSYGAGSTTNRFFPALGNHDWATTNGASPYLDYFTLPGNERYYDYVMGAVHFFVVDSDINEPDGIGSTSAQAAWLQAALSASTSDWNLVYFHHPPFSSGLHGSNPTLQWQFADWGADAVLSGHDHTYERIIKNGIPYFVNGLGGRSLYAFYTPAAGSRVRYNSDYGAMLVNADDASIKFQMISVSGLVVDEYILDKLDPTVASIVRASPNPTSAASVNFTVTFTKPVSGVDASDFTLATNGIAGAVVTNVSGEDDIYTVTVSVGTEEINTLRLDLLDDDSILSSTSSLPLGGSGSDNGNFTTGETYNLTKSVTFFSSGLQDGRIVESAETSSIGGAINSISSTLNIGDNALNNQVRSILSFDTSTLADNATLVSATLQFKYAGKKGTLPFSTHGYLRADVRNGAFSADPALQVDDFIAAASKNAVLSYDGTVLGNWYIKSFSKKNLKFINLIDLTQFRLRFALDDNNDLGADLLKIYSGNAGAANRPQLVIEYFVVP